MGGTKGQPARGVALAVALLVSACSGKIDPSAGTGTSSSGSPSPGTSGGPTGNETASDLLFGPCIVVPMPTSECRGSAKASAVCAEKGFILLSLADRSTSCEARCCTKAPPSHPTPTACTMEAIGDRTSCIPHAEIKTRALGLCDARGMVVQDVYSADGCPGGATLTNVECCPK